MDDAEEKLPQLGPDEFRIQVLGRTHIVRFDGGDRVWVDGIASAFIAGGGGTGPFWMTLDAKTYRFWQTGRSSEQSEFDLLLNGLLAHGTVDDRRSLIRRSMIGGTTGEGGRLQVKAPMPGLVTKILVTQGMQVDKGQGVLLLEAMKMENELKAESSGLVQEILVAERTPVEKGQILLILKKA